MHWPDINLPPINLWNAPRGDTMNEEQLKRLTQLEHSTDCPSRYIRMMASEILELRAELAKFKDDKNWTRSYDYKGDLIKEHALYKPRLR